MEKPKKRRRWIVWIVILAVVAAGSTFLIRRFIAQRKATVVDLSPAEQTYVVERGTLEKTITATGVLSALEQEPIKLPTGLLVDEVLVIAGEAVQEGQVLARFDPASVSEQLAYLAKKVADEDHRLGVAGNNASIKVPAKGRVKYLPVKEGDDVLEAMQKYGVLAILSADGFMRLSIETDRELKLGSRMEVRWDGGHATGRVDLKTPTGYSILVPDEHAPYLAHATLMDGETEVGGGTLEINVPVEIVGYDGVIRTIRYELDKSTPDKREMFELAEASVSVAFSSRYATRCKWMDLYKRAIALSTNPCVTAPSDGVIGEISIKAGETVGKVANADNESVAFTLGTGGAGKLTVNVDELDILSVMLGQEARISLDALAAEPLTAQVTRISVVGKKEGSISTFPVELTLPADARLMAGMNGTATILVERAEGVLLVPLAAIGEDADGTYVYVLAKDGGKVRTAITTGRSDSAMAEVTAGLNEGDTLSYLDADMATSMPGMVTTVAVG